MDTEMQLTPAQQAMVALWEEHMRCEFEAHSADETMLTMSEGAYVNNVPVLTGGIGLDGVKLFYENHFIPHLPQDTEVTPVSRTIGHDQIVDEVIFRFTHSIEMDWMLPGIAPTNKPVEIPLVAIIKFRDGKVAHEHIYWDQASVLVQLGILDTGSLPVAGRETAKKVLNPVSEPSNELIAHAHRKATH